MKCPSCRLEVNDEATACPHCLRSIQTVTAKGIVQAFAAILGVIAFICLLVWLQQG